MAQEAAGRPLLTPIQSYLLVSAFFVLVSLYLRRHNGAIDETIAVAAPTPESIPISNP